ncbi:MAG: tRNA pseudouridine(13) synthase TruD [Candidatus Woesearchaeota archaeon]
MVKYKQVPEDFIVSEINEFEIKKNGDYRLYSIEKKSIESLFLISFIGKTCNIPSKDIGIAGLKDKHAITKQYLTIPRKYEINLPDEKNIIITFIGFVDKPITSGDLIGNEFQITVRDIKKGELDGIYQKAETIASLGVPNYYDSQRFGSVICGEFIAMYLIKKDYEFAVKIFMTASTRHEQQNLIAEKNFIYEHWKDFGKLTIGNPELSKIQDEYKKTGEFLFAYKRIPEKLRDLYISAYQSYIWNENLKQLLWKCIDKKRLYSIKYNIGSLTYFKSVSSDELSKLPKYFRTISHNMEFENELEKEIIEKFLIKEGILLSDFNIHKATGNFFKTLSRDVLLFPTNFSISEPEVDELNDFGKNNLFKIQVSFTLPKGSYATVVTKRLFNQ